VTLSASLLLSLVIAADPESFERWEKEIVGIEKRLAAAPPAKGGVVFAGSSSIRLWNLAKSFPDQKYVNVGFGGSEIRDTTHFVDRLLVPLEPKAIVFYAGDNDIAKKRTPEQVRDDFSAFVKAVRAKLPKAKIHYLPVKPSLARWAMYDAQTKANAYVKAACAADPLLGYIDIVPATLGADGKPKPEFFVKDGLHLSEAGYKAWSDVVRKALE
jgi:lysophospholipase L1-like esterase